MGLRLDIALFEKTISNLENIYTQDEINNVALRNGADVLRIEMWMQAHSDPKRRSGTLANSIAAGAVKGGGTRRQITVGVHGNAPAFYAAWVEFGHGGPRPAGPHPYVLPSFDRKADEAYRAIRDTLASAKIK